MIFKSIVSIQSYVTYGYVGNKAAMYPLNSMGYEVLPINTVQFSNHLGYGRFGGEITSTKAIKTIIEALKENNHLSNCCAMLSGYIANKGQCEEIKKLACSLKKQNKDVIYLCDPVMGDNQKIYVKQEVVSFFKKFITQQGSLIDIITPNQFEAELLSNIKIKKFNDLKKVAKDFHDKKIATIVITGVKLDEFKDKIGTFVSDQENDSFFLTNEHKLNKPLYGTGDLFSALFLGSFLANNKNSIAAAKNTLFHMDKVIKNTIDSNSNELNIIGTTYSTNNEIDIEVKI
jgi:pyridoxine kinase